MEKQQITFKIDSIVLRDFDEVLTKFQKVTGVKPVRQNAIETAMVEYTAKLHRYIEQLKGIE